VRVAGNGEHGEIPLAWKGLDRREAVFKVRSTAEDAQDDDASVGERVRDARFLRQIARSEHRDGGEVRRKKFRAGARGRKVRFDGGAEMKRLCGRIP
jgi:hypothetical protein